METFQDNPKNFLKRIMEEENVNGAISEISSEMEIVDINNVEDDRNHPSSGETSSHALESDNSDCTENNPYGNLIHDLVILKERNKNLQAEVLRLEKENARLEADRSPELHANQLEVLERTIQQQRQEIERLRESVGQQSEVSRKHIAQLKQEYDTKLERLNKQYEIANKEREAMVMKYAVSEKSVIDLKRDIQSKENKMKEAIKERDSMQAKMKTIASEKLKLSQLLDSKNTEITTLERENEKRKDECYARDSKLKWAQNRLKCEVDSHLETQSKLDKLQQKFNEIKEEMEQFKKHTQMVIKSYQEEKADKKNQEQEQKAKLIIDKHDEEIVANLQLELENMKKKQQGLIDENNQLCVKIQSLEKERLEYEYNLSRMKQFMDSEKQTVVDLQSQLTELDSTKLLLTHEQERLVACQAEVERLRLSNSELLQEMETCRERESELLEFTQKLTEKNVSLQSEFNAVEAKAQQIEIEHNSCKRQISHLTSTNTNLEEELKREKSQRQEENQLLARHLAEQSQRADSLAQSLADQQGENQLLKKKNLVSLKELTKELQVCRKRLEQYENSAGSISLGQGSRTSSNTSLNTVEINENKSSSSQASPAAVPAGPVEPDRQILIDKIVKIQRSNARKAEKIEFLEEHVRQLVTELQKKTRIIQNYITREQSGALSSEMMDNNKAALAKHGGIMASVYNSKAVDEGMTLELSLEINQKLQAVLEDTLLKNITLKENMETLGNEIARLTSCKQLKQES